MYDHGKRATDQQAAPNRRKGDVAPRALSHDIGPSAFPLFADPPFLTWQIQRRKYEVLQQIHPSAQPLILLWDEVDDREILS
jgi:hypothetical protein